MLFSIFEVKNTLTIVPHIIRFLQYELMATERSLNFYRAMHCSAKRGIAIACRPSLRL